jgi:hypothetical protein
MSSRKEIQKEIDRYIYIKLFYNINIFHIEFNERLNFAPHIIIKWRD